MLLELPLCQSSCQSVVLNVGMKVYKQVKANTYDIDLLINAYTKRPVNMGHLCLIDVARSWSYDKHRRGEKWLPQKTWAIVRVFPW